MKGYRRLGIIVIVGIASCLLFASLSFAEQEELDDIQAAIRAKGASWTAGESWVTRLSPEERRKLLGEITLEPENQEPSEPPPTDGYPAAIDWRNVGGHNWITPIRDQSSCGSCVAFGSCATVESLARIEQGQPTLNIDLSEMHLFNCGGGTCSGGWYNSSACLYLKNNGTPDEACWPYVPVNRSCSNTCPDWQSRATKITRYGYISGIESHKTYVAIAPILVSFRVYEDFYYYTGGIYEYTSGAYVGGHAVSIVGYDTTGPIDYWIVKNSWGDSWGESGFFRIKMGECTIETRSSYWMSGAIVPSIPAFSGWIFMPQDYPDFGYSLDEEDLVYFYSFNDVQSFNLATGGWFTHMPTDWVYFDWPFYCELVPGTPGIMWFALPPADGIWLYHFSTGQWEILPRIIP